MGIFNVESSRTNRFIGTIGLQGVQFSPERVSSACFTAAIPLSGRLQMMIRASQ